MGRKPEGTIKIWRETLNALAKEHGTSVTKVSEMMGRDATWIYKKMPKGFGLFNEIETIAMASEIEEFCIAVTKRRFPEDEDDETRTDA